MEECLSSDVVSSGTLRGTFNMTAEGFYVFHARQICESLSPFQVNCCFCVFILGFTECVVTLSKKVTLITHYCVSTFMRQAGEAPGQLLWA